MDCIKGLAQVKKNSIDLLLTDPPFGIDFHNYFRSEIDELRAPGGQSEQGFVSVAQEGIEVLPLGRLFVRNVCMVFDAYLKKKNGDRQVFSRTV